MLNKVVVALLVALAISASVPCTQYQASKFGTASSCSISRVDSLTITWGAQINFSADFKWADNSYSNVLADMSSPRLPIGPKASKCDSKTGSYSKGQSVLINCTQAFDQIPTGYADVVTAFDHTDYPLGFSLKIPLSMEEESNLQLE
jgi:hypothetical protein